MYSSVGTTGNIFFASPGANLLMAWANCLQPILTQLYGVIHGVIDVSQLVATLGMDATNGDLERSKLDLIPLLFPWQQNFHYFSLAG